MKSQKRRKGGKRRKEGKLGRQELGIQELGIQELGSNGNGGCSFIVSFTVLSHSRSN